MLQYMCKRLLRSLVTLLIIVVVIFSLLRLMPEEGYFDNYDKLTPSEIENKLTLMGLRDALPIREETGASYASEHDGFMHACGHDVHGIFRQVYDPRNRRGLPWVNAGKGNGSDKCRGAYNNSASGYKFARVQCVRADSCYNRQHTRRQSV